MFRRFFVEFLLDSRTKLGKDPSLSRAEIEL